MDQRFLIDRAVRSQHRHRRGITHFRGAGKQFFFAASADRIEKVFQMQLVRRLLDVRQQLLRLGVFITLGPQRLAYFELNCITSHRRNSFCLVFPLPLDRTRRLTEVIALARVLTDDERAFIAHERLVVIAETRCVQDLVKPSNRLNLTALLRVIDVRRQHVVIPVAALLCVVVDATAGHHGSRIAFQHPTENINLM